MSSGLGLCIPRGHEKGAGMPGALSACTNVVYPSQHEFAFLETYCNRKVMRRVYTRPREPMWAS